MGVPNNIVNKNLYIKIKKNISKRLTKQGIRWGVYASSELHKKYKSQGGKYYKSIKKQNGITRWFKEKWIDVCKLPKIKNCGRKNLNEDYPYCRPMYKISKNTPKTVSEISKDKIKSMCNKKRKNPYKIIKL